MGNCEYYQELISCMLDGELTSQDEERLRTHMESCAECRAMYEAFSSLSGTLAADLEDPPAELTQGIMFKVRASEAAHRKRGRVRVGRIAAAAACLAVVIFAATQLDLSDSAAETDLLPGVAPRMNEEAVLFSGNTAALEDDTTEGEAPESAAYEAPQADAALSAEPDPLSEPAVEPAQGINALTVPEDAALATLPGSLTLESVLYTLQGQCAGDVLPEQAVLWGDIAKLEDSSGVGLTAAGLTADGQVYQLADDLEKALYLSLPDGSWALYTAN